MMMPRLVADIGIERQQVSAVKGRVCAKTARSIRCLSQLALLFFGLAFAHSLLASNSCDARGQSRPSVGLVLSGGGARGATHIGVIKVLEQLRVPIDCIAGTSMGSVIGGLYASGMSTAELEEAIAQIDWHDVFHDHPERANRSFRRKTDDLLYLIKQKPRIKEGHVNFGSALVQGQKFDLVLSDLTLPVRDVKDFDALKIPFRAVATDISNGQEVVLGRGQLGKALRASMAVPAAFAAVEIDGRLLVDGGISNNLPISVARDMGADIVIAVDISSPLLGREELGSTLSVVSQLSGLLTRRNVEQQLATLTDRDVLIVPDLGDLGSADFDRIRETVPIGEAAADALRSALVRYAQPPTDYARYAATHSAVNVRSTAPVIEFIQIENDSSVSDETIAAHLGYATGQPLDVQALEEGIGRVYGMDIFETVRYRVVEKGGKAGIVVDAKERSWGTDSIQAGVELSADLKGDSYFNIGLAFTKIPINELNGEWRTIVQLGEEPTLFTEIYQPLDPAEHWFVGGGIGLESLDTPLYVGNKAVAEYDIDQYGFYLSGGYNFGSWGRLQAAWWRLSGDADVSKGTAVPDFDFNVGELRVKAMYDTLDNLHFPREGMLGGLTWTASREALGGDTDFDQYTLGLGGAKSWGNHTVLTSLNLSTTPGDDAPIQSRFRTGGFLHLSGLQQRELSGQHAVNLLGGYMYRMTEKIVPTYLGASLEAGNVWQDESDIAADDLLLAGSVFVGADTLLGPLYVALGHAQGGHSAFYLFLGNPWFER